LKLEDQIRKALCNAFCSEIGVHAVPAGIAVSTPFSDISGDLISFYLINEGDEYWLEDDGDYLANLIAMGVPIDVGQREQLLNSILSTSGAFYDKDTFEIRTDLFDLEQLSSRVVDFMSSLIRVRDLELFTRETVRSTFKEDAATAIADLLVQSATIEENVAPTKSLSEFPADIVVTPNGEAGQIGAIYCVNTNEKMSEALLAHLEADNLNLHDVRIIALLEDAEMRQLSRKKFQRAQNRNLLMPIFRGDEDASVKFIARSLKLPT
jgi:hypothetical protein